MVRGSRSDEAWSFHAPLMAEPGRRLTARYDKTADSCPGFILVASARLWGRRFVNRG